MLYYYHNYHYYIIITFLLLSLFELCINIVWTVIMHESGLIKFRIQSTGTRQTRDKWNLICRGASVSCQVSDIKYVVYVCTRNVYRQSNTIWEERKEEENVTRISIELNRIRYRIIESICEGWWWIGLGGGVEDDGGVLVYNFQFIQTYNSCINFYSSRLFIKFLFIHS